MPEFSQDLFDKLCERIAEGQSLRKACKSSDMPGTSSVFRWLADDEKLREQYARARDAQADNLFEDCLDIADDASPEEVAKARLRIDTRKWMAGKLRPKRYGDKLELDGQVGVTINLPEGSQKV